VARPTEGAYVLRLAEPSAPEAYLVVLRGARSAVEARVAALAAAWGLSPRQAEVLRLLARGDSNKDLAASLGAAEVMVERHVTALLQKARCETRARLIVRFRSSGGLSRARVDQRRSPSARRKTGSAPSTLCLRTT
jgi:DNA-binding CsgD family transcriptional regulator